MVSFNGVDRIIKISNGVTTINIQEVYSLWKKWVSNNNANFFQAFRFVGGDPTVEGQRLGVTYFIMNNWRIEPFSGDHTLTVIGNLFADDGDSPYIKPIGNYNILILSAFSNLSTIIETNNSSGSSVNIDATTIAKEVWNTNISHTSFTQSGSIGYFIANKLVTVKKLLGLI